MKVDWSRKINGIPLIKIRDLLRHLGSRGLNIEDVCARLNLDEVAGSALIAELVTLRWLALDPKGGEGRYVTTDEGRALRAAKSIGRITRAKAQQILDGLLRRVHEVNSNDDFGVFVDEVYIFGSFLDQSQDRLGDVDIAVNLRFRRIVGRKISTYEEIRKAELGVKGWVSGFLEKEVLKYLKSRDPYISLASAGRIEYLNIKMSLLYRAPDEVRLEHAHRGRSKATT